MPTDATMPAPARPSAPSATAARVTTVLVSHDGAAWLPRTLAALAAQTRQPDSVVAVDTGSADESRALIAAALGSEHIVEAGPSTGFGAAVLLGLAHVAAHRPQPAVAELVPDTGGAAGGDIDYFAASAVIGEREWIWLLHDDAEPDPRALEILLAEVARDPSIGVAGPKVRGWYDQRLLLEVGVTIARSGRRETLLERREQDQGQHDGMRQVLAVNTAGMLVRRDVWEELGGLEPALPLLRDDVDFGWRATLAGHRVVCVTDAVVHHAEAASQERRAIAVRRGAPRKAAAHLHRLDRQHAIRVLLFNLPLSELPFAVLRLTLGTLLRTGGYLLGKLATYALDELWALISVLLRPDLLIAARVARRRTRHGSPRAAHRLLAPRGSGIRHFMETANLLFGPGPGAAAGGAHRAIDSGPTAEEADDMLPWGGGLIRRLTSRPGPLLAVGLVVVALIACRALYGNGRLMGGALLPAPDSAADLWRTYYQAWHPVGIGSDTDAPPYLAVVAMLGALLLGHASAAVDVLLIGGVPLAGIAAYIALRPVVRSVPLRAWGAATYALLPPMVGGVAAGRLSTTVVAITLPFTLLLASRAVQEDTRQGSNRAAWGAGLLLAVMTAFAPLVYLVALALLGLAAATVVRGRDLARLVAIAVVPPVLLLPWLPALVAHPSLLLLEAGLPSPALTDDRLSAVAIFLLHPGGPGMYPLLLTVGVLLAALAGLLRRDRRRLVLAGWCVAGVALAAALVQTRISVRTPTLEATVPAWSGPVLLVAGAGLIVAGTIGAEGARARLAAIDFGWRQPVALLLTVVAGLVPVLAAGWWLVTGADDPLGRRDSVLLPAFIAAEGAEADQPRTLVLRPRSGHRLAYALLRADGPRLGDAETAKVSDRSTGLDGALADLASGRGGDAAAALLPYGVRFVLMTSPLNRDLARDIDTVAGLVRVSGPQGSLVWRVQYPSGRVRVLDRRHGDPSDAAVLASGPVNARAAIEAGPSGRLVVVADRASSGWRGTVDGHPLQATTYDGWAQAFRLPTQGGIFRLHYDQGHRPLLLWLQGAALLVVIVLVLPAARLRAGDSDDRLVSDLPVPPRQEVSGVGARRRR
jgi:GT2 family glycosyltransferase